jgi:hypothetical protein
MSASICSYRPTDAAMSRAGRKSPLPVPREIHVHADGHAVALYERHGDMHFASLFGLLDHHDLTQRDLESASPSSTRIR